MTTKQRIQRQIDPGNVDELFWVFDLDGEDNSITSVHVNTAISHGIPTYAAKQKLSGDRLLEALESVAGGAFLDLDEEGKEALMEAAEYIEKQFDGCIMEFIKAAIQNRNTKADDSQKRRAALEALFGTMRAPQIEAYLQGDKPIKNASGEEVHPASAKRFPGLPEYRLSAILETWKEENEKRDEADRFPWNTAAVAKAFSINMAAAKRWEEANLERIDAITRELNFGFRQRANQPPRAKLAAILMGDED